MLDATRERLKITFSAAKRASGSLIVMTLGIEARHRVIAEYYLSIFSQAMHAGLQH